MTAKLAGIFDSIFSSFRFTIPKSEKMSTFLANKFISADRCSLEVGFIIRFTKLL